MDAIIRHPGFILAAALASVLPASAAISAWNSTDDGDWNVSSNWTPSGVPDSLDDVELGSVAGTEGTTTALNTNGDAGSLTMTRGNDLNTASHLLRVNGLASITNAGTTLLLGQNRFGQNNSLIADSMEIGGDGAVKMLGGRFEIDGDTGSGRLDITGGGTLIGYGTLYLSKTGPGRRIIMENGTLAAGYLGSGIIIGDTAGTLHINAASTEATLDLDQGPSSTISVRAAGTLDVNVALNDPYGSIISLSRKSTLDMAKAWSFNGTLNVATQAGGSPGQTKGPATIAGATMTQTGGRITLDHADDHLIFGAPLDATGGIIDHDAGTLQFDTESTIGSGVDFKVGNATELIVNTRLTVNDADWDWDGDGNMDNVITIRAPGRLVAMLNAPGTDDMWTGLMHLDGGSLWVGGSENTWGSNGRILVEGESLSRIEGGTMTQAGNGASLEVAGTAGLDMLAPNTWEGGELIVDGRAYLNDNTTWSGAEVSGSGVIQQNSDATVTENTLIRVDTYDMDGNREANAFIRVNDGKTLTIDSARIESGGGAFDGRIALPGGTLAVQADWSLGNQALLTFSRPGDTGGSLAPGGTMTLESGATISVWGTRNQIATDLVMEEGSHLAMTEDGSWIDIGVAEATTTLAGGNIFQDPGISGTVNNKGDLLVTGDSEITVTNFRWDGGRTTIESTGNLVISVDHIDTFAPLNEYNKLLTIKGGSLSVDNSEDLWVNNTWLRFIGGGTIQGDPLRIGSDASDHMTRLEVSGGGLAWIKAPVIFSSRTQLATSSLFGTSTFRTNHATFDSTDGATRAEFGGDGTWLLTGHNIFNEPTTFDMSGGTVDFDNSVDGLFKLFAYDTDINADLTVNVGTLSPYGSTGSALGSPRSEMNISSAAVFTVNLDDPAAAWTVNSLGVVNYNGVSESSTFLAGADLRMQGTLNVFGAGRCGARMDISGTVNIKDAGGNLRLGGGNDSDNPNTLAAGTIHGPGTLATDVDASLAGYGTIEADIDFPGSAALYADNGVLTLSGAILDVYRIGTNDDDGILEVANPWSTEASGASVRMNGGELRGATLTVGESSNIRGHGLVSARVINNGTILTSSAGETLVLESSGNDNIWDGSTKNGNLVATFHATLELRDTGDYPFSGGIQANQGATVFLNGFRMTLGSLSSLDLAGGSLEYSGGPVMDIMGRVSVSPGSGNSQLATRNNPGGFRFKAGARVALNGNLEFNSQTMEIEKDVEFSGTGNLLNNPGCTLTLRHLARLTGHLQNRGSLVLGSSPGHVVGENFTQLADGTMFIEIAGTEIEDRDTLRFSGDTRLAGTLDLSLLNGFVPSLGQTYNFLESAAISGTFDNVIQPPTMPEGLKFEVNYAPSEVSLTVVSAGDAYQEWIDGFASLVNPDDKLKTADPDGDGLDNLAEFALDGDPTTPAASGKLAGKTAAVSGSGALTLTFPVRAGAVHAADDPAGGEFVLAQSTEGLRYAVQGSPDLETFPLDIAEVTGADAAAIQAGLPPLGDGWTYRTFRCPGTLPGSPAEFMRVRISE